VDDQKEGFGVYHWPDGKKYEGQWLQGKQHGEGKIVNSKGKSRRGIWEDGNRISWIETNTTTGRSNKSPSTTHGNGGGMQSSEGG
jgi:hypothetical protein